MRAHLPSSGPSSRLAAARVGGAASVLLAAALFGAACGGTTVVDAPDPKACASGHGCPMVACLCGDGSVVVDTTCELGECLDQTAVCDARCADYEGTTKVVASADDNVAIPECETFCTRAQINGCDLACDTFMSQCLPPSTCDAAAASYWSCVVSQGVMSCEDNALRITNCDAADLALCSP